MKVFMCHTANSHYTVRALESIGSKHEIYLWDGSFHEELSHWAQRNEHCRYESGGYHKYVGGKYESEIPTLGSVWNGHINRLRLDGEDWAVHVGPDICLDTPALDMLEMATRSMRDDIGLILCGCPTDKRGSFNVFAVRPNVWKEVGGFHESYRPCGGEDDDFHLRLVRAGWRWVSIPLPMHHMDMGHKSRPDRLESRLALSNRERFESRNGIELGGTEFHEEVNARRAG